MIEQDFGTVAALAFSEPPRQGFEDIVEEFDIAFRPVGLSRRALIWDGEDIAILERDMIRIALGWLPLDDDTPGYLVIAIGQRPDAAEGLIDRATCDFVKTILLDHAAGYLPVGTVLHADAALPVGTDLIDTLLDTLRAGPEIATARPRTRITTRVDRFTYDGPFEPEFEPGTTAPDPAPGAEAAPPEEHEPAEASETAPISRPMRLTIYTLGATMLIYTPPVGASLLIYSTLRDLVPDGLRPPAQPRMM